jgi:hypothetical protein
MIHHMMRGWHVEKGKERKGRWEDLMIDEEEAS